MTPMYSLPPNQRIAPLSSCAARFGIRMLAIRARAHLQHDPRPTTVKFFRTVIVFFAVAFLTTHVGGFSKAAEMDCEQMSAPLRSIQESLYHYAVLAEVPYGDGSASTTNAAYGRSCKIGQDDRVLHPADAKKIRETQEFAAELSNLLRSQGNVGSDKRLKSKIEEYGSDLNSDQGKRWHRQFVAIDDRSGVTYIGCRHDSLTPRLFVTWKELSVDGVPTIVDQLTVQRRQVTLIVPQIYVAVTRDIDRPNAVKGGIDWEELGLVRLEPVDPESGVGEVVAIRGTDWENLSTVITSVKDVLADSCAFESAAVVVKVIGSRIARRDRQAGQKRVLVVTGHSLGGSATQFIGQSNLGPNRHAIRGYAFNAVGIDGSRSSGQTVPNESLYSQYVHGDAVSMGGQFLGRIQPGTVLVSKPASILPDWLSDLFIDPFHRHKLDTVQKALCQCLIGKGRVVER